MSFLGLNPEANDLSKQVKNKKLVKKTLHFAIRIELVKLGGQSLVNKTSRNFNILTDCIAQNIV
jgi:hypothetical protein